MIGRLLECLEQGVEGTATEHVDLVDQVDLEGAACRGVGGVLTQSPYIIHAGVAGGIDLHDIETPSFGDLDAGIADTTGIVGGTVRVGLTVQGLGENACRGGLPDATRSDKEIGLGESIPPDRVLESSGDVLLADDLLKFLRSVFSCKDAVAHRWQNLEEASPVVEG